MSQSRSAFPVVLELYEVEVMIEFHREVEIKAADDRDYLSAQNSKCRREELEESLKARRDILTAEALALKTAQGEQK